MLIYVPENETDWKTERAEMLDALDDHINRGKDLPDYKPGEGRGFKIVATY